MDHHEVKPCLQCRVCGSKDANSEKGWTATSFSLCASGRSVDEFLVRHLTAASVVAELMICSVCLDLVTESDRLFVMFEESLNRIRARNTELATSLYVNKSSLRSVRSSERDESSTAETPRVEAKKERNSVFDDDEDEADEDGGEDGDGFDDPEFPEVVPEVLLREKSDEENDDDDDCAEEVDNDGDSDYDPEEEGRRRTRRRTREQRKSMRQARKQMRAARREAKVQKKRQSKEEPQEERPEGEPAPKKRRGRPPKNAKPVEPKVEAEPGSVEAEENGRELGDESTGNEGDVTSGGEGSEGAPRKKRAKGIRKSYKKSTTFLAATDGDEPAVVCKTCGKTFPYLTDEDKKRYGQHRRLHAMERRKERNVCPICGYKARSTGELNSHVAVVHEKQKPHKCNYCGKAFSTPATKSVHEKRVHAEIVGFKLIICDCCGKGFTSASALKAHRGEYKYDYSGICDICGETVKNVKVHVSLKHKGPPSCRVCGKVCKNFWAKRFHESKEHGIGKPKTRTKYKCDVCGREFWARFNLVRHLAQKHGRRPAPEDIFTCPHCNKEFYCKVTWREHVNGHLGITPYSCPACGYATNIESNLHLHVRQVHKSRLSQVKAAIKAAEEAAAAQAAEAADLDDDDDGGGVSGEVSLGAPVPGDEEAEHKVLVDNLVGPQHEDQLPPLVVTRVLEPQQQNEQMPLRLDHHQLHHHHHHHLHHPLHHEMSPRLVVEQEHTPPALDHHMERVHHHLHVQRLEHLEHVQRMQGMDTDDSSSIPEAMTAQ